MKRIAFLLASIFYFAACTNEVFIEGDIPSDATKPQIELFFPDTETVNLYSTATVSENTIDTVWVIAFNGTTKMWVEKIAGTQIARNGYASQLLPQLANEPLTGWKIVCIANVDPNPDTTSVTPTTINSCFQIRNKGYYYGGDYLPMYGELDWLPSSGYKCVMTRAVAKIQVQMGTSVSIADSIGNFSAETVRYKLYYGGGAGAIQPPASGVASGGNAFTPETNYRYLLQSTSATEQNSNTYIFEFPSSDHQAVSGPPQLFPDLSPDTIFYAERQHLILEKDNGGGDLTYYRLDFYNPVTKKFLDTERNHHYLFTINKVRSEGYRTLEEAQNNPGSNIEYTIKINDGATRSTSNGQYAIVTTNMLSIYHGSMDTLSLASVPGSNGHAVVSARIQIPIQMDASAWYPSTRNEIVVEPDTYFELSGNNFLQPPTAPPTPETVSINIKPGIIPSPTVGTLIFRVGNITHKVNFVYTYSI